MTYDDDDAVAMAAAEVRVEMLCRIAVCLPGCFARFFGSDRSLARSLARSFGALNAPLIGVTG